MVGSALSFSELILLFFDTGAAEIGRPKKSTGGLWVQDKSYDPGGSSKQLTLSAISSSATFRLLFAD